MLSMGSSTDKPSGSRVPLGLNSSTGASQYRLSAEARRVNPRLSRTGYAVETLEGLQHESRVDAADPETRIGQKGLGQSLVGASVGATMRAT